MGRLCLAKQSRAARRMTGVEDDQELGSLRLFDFQPDWVGAIVRDEAFPSALQRGSWEGDTAILGKDGAEIPVSQVVLAHCDAEGKPIFLSTIARDVSERKQFESRLSELANQDSLTGLFNRRRFLEEVGLELIRSERSGASGGLLFLDLDGFKFVNDELGHAVGDELLQAVAKVLTSSLRGSDAAARLGGDEFAVLLPAMGEAQVAAVAERLLLDIREIRIPAKDQIVRITASIGASSYPADGLKAEDLLARSDIAMYAAKTERDSVRFYDASTLVVFESGNRRVIEQSVREALENDGLILYAQPIKNLKSESVHWEVLARMKLPDGSIIGPDAFLPVAERSGLIHALDRAVVSKAIDVLAQREAANTPIHLAVNLSAKAFDDPELLPLISERIRATGISPASIMFEITETATITNVLKAQEFLRYLRALGCKFAIDDFGVGLSSYYYLKTLPVDYLKIDGSFIRNLPNDTADQHLVKSMVEMARGLGKETVAEFVGDQATLDLLRELGVDHGQGYFLGKHGPIDDVLAQGGRDSEAA